MSARQSARVRSIQAERRKSNGPIMRARQTWEWRGTPRTVVELGHREKANPAPPDSTVHRPRPGGAHVAARPPTALTRPGRTRPGRTPPGRTAPRTIRRPGPYAADAAGQRRAAGATRRCAPVIGRDAGSVSRRRFAHAGMIFTPSRRGLGDLWTTRQEWVKLGGSARSGPRTSWRWPAAEVWASGSWQTRTPAETTSEGAGSNLT